MFRNLRGRLLLLLCGMVCGAANASAVALPDTLKLVYSATFGDMHLGVLSVKLTKHEDYYRAEAETKAEGLAAILMRGGLSESCEFTFSGESYLQPRIYHSKKRGFRAHDYSAEFVWEDNQVRYENGHVIGIPSAGYVLDNCSVPYAFNPTATASITQLPYIHIITGKRIRHYEGMKVSEELLDTEAGDYQTVRIDQHRVKSPEKTLSFWVAPELHHVVVKIMEKRPSRKPVVFVLKSIEELPNE